jgi:hypothetical protein
VTTTATTSAVTTAAPFVAHPVRARIPEAIGIRRPDP